MSKTQPARGMRDFLPADVRKRNYVINIIREVYESYGFEPLETPAVENLETLMGKYGEEGNQLVFRILKRGEKLGQELSEGKITSENELSDLALRYDLTVPLARVVANYKNDLPKFFKRYQIQPVWRADRPARGRFREFYQCDVDAIGSNSMMVEAELCAAVCEILKRLGFPDFVIRINHRMILTALLDAAGIPADKHSDALVALDKFDKIGVEGVIKEFENRNLLNDATERLLALYKALSHSFEKPGSETPGVSDDPFDLDDEDSIKFTDEKEANVLVKNMVNFKEINEFSDYSETGLKGIEQLISIISFSQKIEGENAFEKIAKHIVFDVSLARGLSYYTGAIFEINVPDLAGSLGGGGRYDGLIGMFGKEQIPACGFSLGLERILVVMNERGMFPAELETNAADILVTVWNEESIGASLKLANELRRQGMRVLVYPEADKLGKQFKYADALGIRYVCVLGESELAENKVTLKNMQTGGQQTLAREEIAANISGL